MTVEYYKIDPTGNITLIVETPVPRESQSLVAATLMKSDPEAEQVGFLEKPCDSAACARLQMMGGEFCGNASISAVALLAQEGGVKDSAQLRLEVSGTEKPLDISITREDADSFSGRVQMPLPESVGEFDFPLHGRILRLPLVRFPGICHAIVRNELDINEAEANIQGWCRLLGADALGLMFLDGDRLTPLVYVDSTQSSVRESSCASGSCACASFLALNKGSSLSVELHQPGGTLGVDAALNDGSISALYLRGRAHISGHFSAEV